MNDMRKQFKLKESVFFSQVADFTYARDVSRHMDYKFNRVAGKILAELKHGCTLGGLIEALRKQYGIDDGESIVDDVEAFLRDLDAKGLLMGYEKGSTAEAAHIIEGVEKLCQEQHRMWGLGIELTYACNERCVHCYVPQLREAETRTELSTAEVNGIVDDAASMGCMKVLVTGGEPTLRRDFLDICRHIVSKGLLLDVFTNALQIDDETFAGLVGLPLNSVSFSLYGGTPSFHDSITGISGSYEKSLRNILKFKCAGVDVFVKSILFNNHVDEYERLYDLGRQLNLTICPSTIILPSCNGRSNQGMMMDESSAQRYFGREIADKVAQGVLKAYPENISRSPESPICAAGLSSLSVNPFGDVMACNSLPVVLGNVRESSLSDIWENSSKLKRIRSLKFSDMGSKCVACEHAAFCGTCLASMLGETGVVCKPCDYMCTYAKIRHSAAQLNQSNKCNL